MTGVPADDPLAKAAELAQLLARIDPFLKATIDRMNFRAKALKGKAQ